MAATDGTRSASSDRNVERFKGALEAWNRDGLEALLEYFDPGIEVYDPDLPGGGTFHGHEGVRHVIGQLVDGFDELKVRDFELLPSGDRVVGLIHTYGRGGDGIELEIRDAHSWTFRNGKVVYWRLYLDQNEALADAGLEGTGARLAPR